MRSHHTVRTIGTIRIKEYIVIRFSSFFKVIVMVIVIVTLRPYHRLIAKTPDKATGKIRG